MDNFHLIRLYAIQYDVTISKQNIIAEYRASDSAVTYNINKFTREQSSKSEESTNRDRYNNFIITTTQVEDKTELSRIQKYAEFCQTKLQYHSKISSYKTRSSKIQKRTKR